MMCTHVYPPPSQGTALLINVFDVMGKLVVDCTPDYLINLGQDVVRGVTQRTRPGEVCMLRQPMEAPLPLGTKLGTDPLPAEARSKGCSQVNP